MMNNDKFEALIRESPISKVSLPQNRETLKNVLINLHGSNRPSLRAKLLPVPGLLAGFFCVAAVFFLMIDDNDQPGYTNNLGGIWTTFSDSIQGGNSKVWPPVSTATQNLFVKSAPGYGERGYAVRIKGITGTGDNPYCGVKTYLGERASSPNSIGMDLRAYKGIRFKMKGTIGKGKLYFILPSGTNDNNACQTFTDNDGYLADITGLVKNEWSDVKLIFRKDFRGQCLGSIETVLKNENLFIWKWFGEKNQKIDLWIDEIELF